MPIGTRGAWAVLAAAAVAVPGFAEERATSRGPLEGLRFMVGKWELEAAGAASDHLELAWELGGHAIRRSERRTAAGKRWRVEGTIAWNPSASRIEVFRHTDEGAAGRGSARVLAEGEVSFELELLQPDGSRRRERTRVKRVGEDELAIETRTRDGGAWSEPATATLRRVAAFPWDVSRVGRPGGFPADDAQMARFAPFLGVWGPPADSPDPEGRRTVLRWGIPGKTVRFSEHRVVDGERVAVTEALVGYHYGRQQIVQLEFTRDGVNSSEVMNEGTWEFREDGALVRVFRSYDPDMSSREYRETTTLLPDGRRRLEIEYRDDVGRWQPWPRGPFLTVRYPSLEAEAPGDPG